jgi:hypothetical protein
MTLDEILDSQRSANNKSGLGYNKEKISTPKKSYAGPSFANIESRYDSGSSRSRNKSNNTKFRRSDHGRHPEAIHTPQSKFRRVTPSWMNQTRYASVFNGYCFLVINMVIKPWIVGIMEENKLVGSTTI